MYQKVSNVSYPQNTSFLCMPMIRCDRWTWLSTMGTWWNPGKRKGWEVLLPPKWKWIDVHGSVTCPSLRICHITPWHLKQRQISNREVSNFLSSNGSIILYYHIKNWHIMGVTMGYIGLHVEFDVNSCKFAVLVVCLPTTSALIWICCAASLRSSKQILQHRPGTSSGSGWVSCFFGASSSNKRRRIFIVNMVGGWGSRHL